MDNSIPNPNENEPTTVANIAEKGTKASSDENGSMEGGSTQVTSPGSASDPRCKERSVALTGYTPSPTGKYLLRSPVALSSSLTAPSSLAVESVNFQQLYDQALVLPSSADTAIGGNTATTLVHQMPSARKQSPKGNSVDLDATFTSRLRDMRTHLFNDRGLFDHLQRNVMTDIKQSTTNSNSDKNTYMKIQPKFRQFLKALFNIGGGLAQAKEFRDIFEDILVFLSDGLLEMKLDHAEASLLFDAIRDEINRMLPKYSDDCAAYLYVTSRIALVGLSRSVGE
eukprot:CAMPEP_0204822214 /NCGR_PEP_ID=MMETSP1346-20131115/405_1 /ASSEMBLY_ACC=CAM_ASM_000771 /TAXON_ID=215587 /ORGANISM="Aplanochytrium stocchinoi, Strain GSBS06" /LENGTH=282 /DNA_ID=CAMNT_0051948303 /DNA_START=187 /DNA_END=1035 /DNA_ORIENTATION=-